MTVQRLDLDRWARQLSALSRRKTWRGAVATARALAGALLRPETYDGAIAFVRKRVRRRHFMAAGTAVALLAVAAALAPRQAPPGLRSAPKTSATLRLNGPVSPALSGLVLAARAGLFEREGILVEFMPAAEPEAATVGAVASGADTIGLAWADDFLTARGRGQPVVAFAGGYLESPIVFYVQDSSGIRMARDFAGKRVGTQAGRHSALVYEALMQKLELPRNRMQEVAVGSDPAPFLGGAVDVWPGSIADAWTLRQHGKSFDIITPINFGIHLPGTVYVASEKTLRDDPAVIRGFLRALIGGWELAYGDPDRSIPLIVSYDEFTLTPERVRAELDLQREYLKPLAMRFGEFNAAQWRSLRDLLLTQKMLAEPVDLTTAVTYDFLREAYRRPGAYAK
jgi:ABC-type nitrate/sulfonate/bicarbonate transport system substrate-binding protein